MQWSRFCGRGVPRRTRYLYRMSVNIDNISIPSDACNRFQTHFCLKIGSVIDTILCILQHELL